MNLYIKKLSFLFLSLALIFTACETQESIEITSPDPALVLQQPGISSVFLNFGTPTNSAITISWNDDLTGSSSYDVEMSLDADFTTSASLGSATTHSFSISVETLNAALGNAGATNFRDVAVYLRVKAGSTISNAIQYLVTRYPVDAPTISSPTASQAFVLSIATLDATAITVTWADAVLSSTLGIDINYTIEAAAAGTSFASPVAIGTSKNGTFITSTHSDFNAVAIGLGFTPEVAANMDIRVVAKTTNQGGSILTRTSLTRTVSVTPFSVSFPNLFLVGDATTPGWNPNNNNTVIFRNQDVPNAYVYTGYFDAGSFKLLETTNWQPQWGTNGGSSLAYNPVPGDPDPGTFNVATAGYYKYTFTTVGAAGSFTVAPYDASAAPTYPTIGIIGDATPDKWNSDTDFTQDAKNPHLWFLNGVTLTTGGSVLIRANNVWPPDSNAAIWRYTGSKELYGKARLDNGGGDNIPFNEPTGSYDVWFNDLDGSYVIIPN